MRYVLGDLFYVPANTEAAVVFNHLLPTSTADESGEFVQVTTVDNTGMFPVPSYRKFVN